MLLDRSQARKIRATLRVLSRRFLALRPSSIRGGSLAGGHAALALVHAALDAALPGEGHAARVGRSLDRAIDALATTTMSPGLYGGFSGIAWVTELLQGEPGGPPEADPLAAIDDALGTYLSRSPWDEPYDLIAGLAGLGVYALERLPRPSAVTLVALIVDRLEESAQPRRPGVAWRSNPEWLLPELRRDPNPEWNLGVAHGVPAIVAFLGGVCAAGIEPRIERKAHALLEKAVVWLLAQELPKGQAGCFAYAVGPGIPTVAARAAWCYGDPGLAATLLLGARAVGESAWERAAIRIALRAARRPADTCGVVDAGLCHGAAGLAHIFHRLYRATEDERFAVAARSWFARTLAMWRPGRGFGGFAKYTSNAQGAMGWEADSGFLTGTGGIALALAAALTSFEPEWDRALALSLRACPK